jgi:hypothetical protein
MFRKAVSLIVIVSLTSLVSFSQTPASDSKAGDAAKPAVNVVPPAPKPAMQGFGLEDGTPVKLRTSRTISSADEHTGETVDFEVLEDVMVNGTLVIPKGGIAWGTVTEAQAKRRMARGGKLDVNIDAVRLTDGEKVPLRAVKDVKGGGHTGAMTGAMVGTAIVFFPAAPLFLFMHGKDITIPKGTEITAYVSGDTRLDQAKFKNDKGEPAAASIDATTTTMALLEISSTPSGADIEVDGKFIGSTPSSVSMAPGDHDIAVKKAGFSAWSKKLSVSSGHINVLAELVPESK